MGTLIRMFSFILIWMLSARAFSKYPYESTQQLVNRVAATSDTILTGEILYKREIERGLVVNSRPIRVGLMKVKIIKLYRGKLKNKEKIFICTWIDNMEHNFNYDVGKEFIFFGIKKQFSVQLPTTYGHIMDPDLVKEKIYTALKINKRAINTEPIFNIVNSDDYVSRNACNETENFHSTTSD